MFGHHALETLSTRVVVVCRPLAYAMVSEAQRIVTAEGLSQEFLAVDERNFTTKCGEHGRNPGWHRPFAGCCPGLRWQRVHSVADDVTPFTSGHPANQQVEWNNPPVGCFSRRSLYSRTASRVSSTCVGICLARRNSSVSGLT